MATVKELIQDVEALKQKLGNVGGPVKTDEPHTVALPLASQRAAKLLKRAETLAELLKQALEDVAELEASEQ